MSALEEMRKILAEKGRRIEGLQSELQNQVESARDAQK